MRRCFFVVLLMLLLMPLVRAEKTEIVLTFTGDNTLGSEERTRGLPSSFDSYILQNGYAYPFARVQSVLAHDDVTIINLENVFYPFQGNRVEKTYNFRGPPEFVNILEAGSVELSFLGNNHTMDYGINGFRSTVDILEKAGRDWFAVTDHSVKTWIFEKNGIKVGFTGVYSTYWGRARARVAESFEALKAAGCDFIVAVMHGGEEYAPRHGRGQERLARYLIDQGAGFVAGHHPHVLHGVDIYNNANIVYSLGNFSFGGNAKLRVYETMLAQVTLTFDEQGRYTGQTLNLIPAHPSGTLEYNDYQPQLVTGEEARAVIDKVSAISTYTLNPYQQGIGAVQDFLPAQPPQLLTRDP